MQSGYISSAESRTIWVQVDHTNIDKLFGTGFALHGDCSELALGGQPLAARRLGKRARRQGTVVRHAPTSTRGAARSRQRHAGARCRRAGRAWATAAPARPTSFPSRSPTTTTTSRSPAILESRLGHRAATGTIGLVEPGVGAAVPEGLVRRAAQPLSRRARHQYAGAMDVGCAWRRAVSDRPAAGLQSGRRTLARCRRGHGDQPAEPARAVCRLGLQRRRAVQHLHRLPVGLLGSRQQPLGHHLLVRLHVAGGAGLALLFRRATSSSSTPRCATSRCSTTPATAARATSTATA